MIRVADIVVYDEIGQILLLAEVRTPAFSTSADWAVGIRRHSCESLKGFIPRYFLVVARDFSYLWTAPATLNALPDVRVATEELLGHYFRGAEIDAAKIAGSTLELVVGMWLRDLTDGTRTAKQVLPPGVDLAAAAENGRIDFPDAA
jgi:hypothetical protein